jgi:hypothetical protein
LFVSTEELKKRQNFDLLQWKEHHLVTDQNHRIIDSQFLMAGRESNACLIGSLWGLPEPVHRKYIVGMYYPQGLGYFEGIHWLSMDSTLLL